ncbi:polyketide cyclase/dehydrase and lipid transporter [Morchella snyderi]|nr:polyketide cyclase/dehydrase and lipid transporter [Morchella snyderi]
MPPRISLRLPKLSVPRPSQSPFIRTFLNIAGVGGGSQKFSEVRSFPYAASQLYTLVSDINSYHKFLPYCVGSRVTQYSAHDNLPTEADLRVGWGTYDETFRSKVECEPARLIVRADASQNELFKSLKTRWEIRPRAGEGEEEEGKGSDVELHIEFTFKNPVYAALSGAVAPKIVNIMVEAFEKRAKEVLGKGGDKDLVEESEQRAVG